jgi:hypothetical protein
MKDGIHKKSMENGVDKKQKTNGIINHHGVKLGKSKLAEDVIRNCQQK